MAAEHSPLKLLRARLAEAGDVDSLSESFSVFAFDALRAELADRDMRLLLWTGALDEPLNGGESENVLRAQLNQHLIATRCHQWAEHHLHARELTRRTRDTWVGLSTADALIPSADYALTGAGFDAESLGVVASNNLHLVQETTDPITLGHVSTQMDRLWDDKTTSRPVTAEFLESLTELYQDRTPDDVYLKIITTLFADFLDEGTGQNDLGSKTGFFDSVVWNKLYTFQKDGVLGAIQKLERHNGCIIADSVGLGKTFEALAVIKFYELRNYRVLVLAPKRLRENWTLFRSNDTRNPLVKDRFKYDVLNHTDLNRESGFSGDIDLEHINWGNYDLVVIDESHNFRNNPSVERKTKTRYAKLMEDVLQAGVSTKVLMLSATPVNTRLADLKNQVLFATEGDDTALAKEGISSIEGTLRLAQARFRSWQDSPDAQRSAKTLVSHLGLDYIRLLDLVTIARSRKHIEKYYGTSDVGKFPERRKPINVKSPIDSADLLLPLPEINKAILNLNLAAYKPMSYVLPSRMERYAQLYDHKIAGKGDAIFRQEHRENNIVHLMRVNMLKRLESSVNSMTLTVGKILGMVESTIAKLDAYDADPNIAISLAEIAGSDWDDLDFDDPMFDDAVVGASVKILIPDIDRVKWRQDLEDDAEQLRALYEEISAVTVARDMKLESLKNVLRQKFAEPFNIIGGKPNHKVLVFTAFSDTAEYLYKHIAPWVKETFGLDSGLVTGSKTASTLKLKRTDMRAVLAAFSPRSKEADEAAPQIDIIIATDAISEGQNLQDCDTVINYDIHWNPVRIVQRFGRVDRLGTLNKEVQLINFWPDIDLESYINLEKRVSGRMALLDVSATGEENLLTADQQKAMNDLDYRRKQLEQMQTAAPTMEDLVGGLSITDLTLSDFRMDAASHPKAALDALAKWPLALFGVARFEQRLAEDGLRPGAVFLLRVRDNDIPLPKAYPLAPYLLVYVADDGEVLHAVDEPKMALDVIRACAATKEEIDGEALAEFAVATNSGNNMAHYRNLLDAAIAAARGKATESRVASLFSTGPALLGNQTAAGLTSIDVIAWLALLP